MSLRKNDLEKAVQSLLCPRNYEYILFVQSQIEKDPHYLASQKQRQAKNVISVETIAPLTSTGRPVTRMIAPLTSENKGKNPTLVASRSPAY